MRPRFSDLAISPRSPLGVELTRRRFLQASLTAAAGLGTGLGLGCDLSIPEYPFTLGVASGDPLSDRVILWTRLAPDPLNGGGMPDTPVTVIWEIADDEAMSQGLRSGVAVAHPSLGHSVHVDVPGLLPERWYHYRFHVPGWTSPVGRTKTAAAVGSNNQRLRFATASCQSYTSGFYTAYHHMAQEDLDLVVHLGDYIYEGGVGSGVRPHNSGTVFTLPEYRNRYALYKTDPNLMEAHRIFPFVTTWDDHEVRNNYAGLVATEPPITQDFIDRRAAAYAAYYEHLPLRVLPPKGPDLEIFRRLDFGDLLSMFVLDTRQYRTNQDCNDNIGQLCAGFPNPDGTMLGDVQEAWLFDGLDAGGGLWNTLAQSVWFTPVLGPNFDQWDGYPLARDRILDFVESRGVENLVVLTGDIHASGAASIVRDFNAEKFFGAEFVAPGISSVNGSPDLINGAFGFFSYVEYVNGRSQGYVRHDVGRTEWRADLRRVLTVRTPGADIETEASFVADVGVPGIRPA
ncbi:MAG: alkaline phosphatase D family protein [Myxococcota bacterium]|nr:alkaline phosphatase D family protein [Myxococcota bacterium]